MNIIYLESIAFEEGRDSFHSKMKCPYNSENMKLAWQKGYDHELLIKQEQELEQEIHICPKCNGKGYVVSLHFGSHECDECCGVGSF